MLLLSLLLGILLFSDLPPRHLEWNARGALIMRALHLTYRGPNSCSDFSTAGRLATESDGTSQGLVCAHCQGRREL